MKKAELNCFARRLRKLWDRKGEIDGDGAAQAEQFQAEADAWAEELTSAAAPADVSEIARVVRAKAFSRGAVES